MKHALGWRTTSLARLMMTDEPSGYMIYYFAKTQRIFRIATALR